MRKAILGAVSALALASPAMANGVTPYSEVPSYGGADSYVRVPDAATYRCRGAGSRCRGPPACHCSAAASGG
jgi:hypothetical protein